MDREIRIVDVENRRLTPWQWVRAKIKAWQLRRRWKKDAAWREHVQASFKEGMKNIKMEANGTYKNKHYQAR